MEQANGPTSCGTTSWARSRATHGLGIPGVWLADLEQRLMTIYREPSPDGYLSQETVDPDPAGVS